MGMIELGFFQHYLDHSGHIVCILIMNAETIRARMNELGGAVGKARGGGSGGCKESQG